MRRMQRIVLLATLVACAPAISGCANFDLDKLDIFGLGEKKKLAGDRKPVFPEGVPGVTQGIPPEFVKGNQPPPDTALAAPVEPVNAAPAGEAAKQAAAPAAEPKPKAQAKPKRVVKRTPKPAAQQQQQQQSQSPSSWPAPGQGSTTAPSANPWPAAPAPGTFTR